MRPAAIGFRAHTGWAAAVTLAGPPDTLEVIDRRRIDLLAPGVPWEVYHAARPLTPAKAEALVRRATDAAEAQAADALGSMIDEARAVGCEVVASGVVLASGRPPFTLEEALASHAGMHGAEGHLYRGALIHAGGEARLEVLGVPERDLYGRATAELGIAPHLLRQRLGELGQALGAPWRQDQKSATLVAWQALAAHGATRRTSAGARKLRRR